MEIVAKANKNYELNIQMNDEEVNRLITEMELLFMRSISDEKLADYHQIIEFKNLLALSINNAQ